MRTSISLLAILAPLAFADGPCDPTVCEEVTSSDGVFVSYLRLGLQSTHFIPRQRQTKTTKLDYNRY